MANDIILSRVDRDVKKYQYNLTWHINYIIHRVHILYNSVVTWMYKKFQSSKFSEQRSGNETICFWQDAHNKCLESRCIKWNIYYMFLAMAWHVISLCQRGLFKKGCEVECGVDT